MSTSLIGMDDRSRPSLEQQLASCWRGALGGRRVGLHDDLFFLGADPERISIALNKIRQELGVDIAPSEIFEARTIAKQADLIEIRESSLESLSLIHI